MKYLISTFVVAAGLSFSSPLAHAEFKSFLTKKYQIKHAKGFKRTMESRHFMQAIPHRSFKDLSVSIPRSVDLSPQVSLPEDQGNCGACWAFSLTKALRSQWMLGGKDPGKLEFNYLLDNCGPGPAQYGCNGGDFPAAMSFENKAGPGLNSQNPYSGKVKPCKHLPAQATAISYAMLGEGNKGPTFKDIAYAVGVEHHMLSIDVAAGSGNWENYSSGIYNGCKGGPAEIDHMINLVGYDCETSIDQSNNCVFDSNGKPVHGDGYLIVENNWGEDWGLKASNGHGGYMKTRMYGKDGTNCNAIAYDALMFSVNIPGPPPTPIPPKPIKCSGFLCSFLGCWLPWCK